MSSPLLHVHTPSRFQPHPHISSHARATPPTTKITSPPPTTHHLRVATLNIGCGFTRKLPDITARCLALSLDVIALQEIGDPALASTRLPHYQLIAAAGPSNSEAGVGLLISHELTPRCRAYKRSKGGRLVGVILELARGHRLLLASAYMPTGLDHHSPASPAADTAHALYAELIAWTLDVQQVILLGDLNETLTPHDRFPFRARPLPARAPAAPSPIQCLPLEGFTDVYRHLHPVPTAGFTHVISSAARPSRSRIDYIWTRGCSAASLLRACIDTRLQHLTHHHLLWAEVELQHAPPAASAPLFTMRLPNLRAADDADEQHFTTHLDQRLHRHTDELLHLAHSDDPHLLSDCASLLTSLTRHSAFACLPLTGAAPYRSASILTLQHQRRDLTRLMHVTDTLLSHAHTLARSPEWVQAYRRCTHTHRLQWATDVHHLHHDVSAWVAETRDHIRRTRSAIAAETRRMQKHSKPRFDANPAAAVHRMLQSDALPSLLYSVVDSGGALTSSAAELQDVMVSHFESVFALPPPDPLPLPRRPPAMMFEKASILPAWYDGLMEEVHAGEIIETLRSAPRVSAPGEDEVSIGVWKIALQGCPLALELTAALFTSCLRTSTFPSAWKTSIIQPFVKDALKERSMSNIRPISLQSCLGKLFNKLLAHRLGAILARHPILNPAQRGFVVGGTTVKCIDELLDAWDWSRSGLHEQYTLFYDIKQAYDSVQSDVLVRALHRLRLPPAFVTLIADSLTDLTSCIRTVYGRTRSFAVRRSLRQGDPLAPLLFVMLMDALHDGLDTNPFDGQQYGCRVSDVYLASMGYADDTNAVTTTLDALRVQNDWVQYFMAFNSMRLNALKCELVGRGADGGPVTAAAVAAAGITVDGVALQPHPHDQPIRYLGAHSCFDGSWGAQQRKTRELIMIFTRAVSKFRVSVGQAVYMFNVFLLPKLELAMHYVHGPGTSTWIQACDRMLIGSIKHAAASPLMLSHTAVALTLHLKLPSWLEVSVKVSELFLRLNSSDPRWGRLGRVLMRDQCGSAVSSDTPLRTPNSGTRFTRAAYLAVRVLKWGLQLDEEVRAGSRREHLFATPTLPHFPDHHSSAPRVELTSGRETLAHDSWVSWGSAHAPHQPLHVYTDGSFDQASATSSWAVVIGDAWLDDNYGSVPADEQLLRPADVGGATLFGASIACTQGVYPAELQAIARTLAMLPASYHLHIHSDSRSSLEAIRSYQRGGNERSRCAWRRGPCSLSSTTCSSAGRRQAGA